MKDIRDVSTLEMRAGCKGEAKRMVGIKVKRKSKGRDILEGVGRNIKIWEWKVKVKNVGRGAFAESIEEGHIGRLDVKITH